ncbi:MAG TPA: phosphoadenylyl-sulfate reductase [Nitrososphaeraceae archaeon]|jgi:phosphoadenosine phosphosulfate reductase|nr:phosphoadenylyl-sulfate reductase [Nitrososphaeraceae archaeon]
MSETNVDMLKPTELQIKKIAEEMEDQSAMEVLKWAINAYAPKIALASSFGAEDVILIDMMVKINKEKAKIFTLDTGRLNQETYDVMDAIRKKYGIQIEVYFPEQRETEEMVKIKGMNLMYESVENRKLCCEIRKVHPLNRALSNLDGWITGLRREQAITRANIYKLEIDSSHGNIVKINPLADWTNEMIWDYIHKNNVPYNKLHDSGYPSIGCEPCTRAVHRGEDPRAGRWWWENATQKECGLHWDPTKKYQK